ncbi:hypothetical protein AB0J63_26565 [Streptosporangium canum]|uniref:hypothetical protein n=1 Tax=Streptosporangium canum TaxID=324952 RepID=UPI003418413D
MARLLVRDRTMREFEIHESALPFWQDRVEVLDRIPDLDDEPAESPPEESGTTKNRKASRPVQEEE